MACKLVTTCFGVVSKCRQWTDPQSCDVKKLRGMVLGFVLNVTLAEVVAYKLITQDVRAGELSKHVPDVVIIAVSCLEAFAAPLVSWWGARRRRLTLALWMLAPLICMNCWFALPDANLREEYAFCDAANQNNVTSYVGATRASSTRLAVVALTTVVLALARAAVWAHGVALCDEYAPERITVHYGVVLNVRAITLLLGHKIFTTLAETNLTMQTLILVLCLMLGLVQVPFVVPRTTPHAGELDGDAGFLSSVGRVVSSGLAVSQMAALGLLAAALWGYGYYENDIIRAKFLLNMVAPESDNFVRIVQYMFVFFILMFAATRYAAPVQSEYCRRAAIKHVIIMCVLVVALFAGLSLPSCEPGEVAGLGAEYYGHPACSYECGCQPRWDEFAPVCATGDMVTYLSPCHAGCAGAGNVSGINVFMNCTCAGDARVVVGGCAESGCRFALNFHHNMFLMLVTVSLLAFQAQGVLVLKSVERRDRSVALGLTMAAISAVAFVAGPLLYTGIDVSSCRWYEGDRCQLFNERFPKTVGYTSAFIALLATLLCIVTSICVRMADRSEANKRNDETSEEIELASAPNV